MKLIPLILLIFFSVACSKSSSSSKRETTIQQEDVSEIMNNQNFECASLGGSCPSGMARLLIVNPTIPGQSAVCSGFMIGPNRLVTNHHCVPDQTFCNTTFVAIYAGSGRNYLSTRCKSVIRSEQDSPDPNDPNRALDYAILETVNAFSGDVFELSNNLAGAGDLIHSWVIDHTGLDEVPPNLFDSRVTELDCTVLDQSSKASLVMEDCPIISGNSGGAALNTAGEVIGVIWGGTSTGTINSSIDLDIRRQLNELGLATEVNYLRN